MSDDGDPVDVLVANTRPILPGAVMACRPIGVLIMTDEAGGDEKIVAVPVAKISRRYENIRDIADLPEITMKQIEHFFAHYKDLEGDKWSRIERWGDAAEAKRMIAAAMERGKG
jgi:inorganic pyrophosphatase